MISHNKDIMNFRNSIKPFKNCQMFDWAQSDYYDDGTRLFEIRGYGITDKNNSICVHVKGFEPYFYIEVPSNWTKTICKMFQSQLEFKLRKKRDGLKQCKFINSKKLYGFSDYKKFNFIKIKSYNLSTFYECRRIVEGRYPYGIDKTGLCNDRKFKINRQEYDFSDKLYESNITPMLRFFHIRDLQPNGWISVNKHTTTENPQTRCQLEIDCNYKDICKVDKNEIAPLIIASFDIECTSIDGSFPDARRKGDEVIQIGTTFHRYGEKSCFYKNIITLKKCNKIEGVDVISCHTELDVIIKWAELINRVDPDIITGYNIWGFDMSYIDRRCVDGCGGRYGNFSEQFYEIYSRNNIHKLKPKTSTLQREINDLKYKIKNIRLKESNSTDDKNNITSYETEIKDLLNKIKEKSALSFKKLESSGLGQNFLKFWEVEGMISIDMYKVIQSSRDNFVSYKLDYVSQQYIRGKIKNIIIEDNVKMLADNVDGLTVGQHISLSITSEKIDKQYLKTKFEIIDIDDKCFTITGVDINKLFTEESELEKFKENELPVEWYQNKIDLSPQQLFKNYKNGAADKITEIAVYCIKDCELVNFLVIKLETIANNVGEGNVCSVPMSYLFLRGQGAKIYSCFAKECRERGLLIKVLKRFDEKSKDKYKYLYKYDGATVFPPTPGMYFDPVAVMDYASLYPSSMIAENISHDTLVKVIKTDKNGIIIPPVKEYEFYYGSDKYLGLEDYNYNEITFNNYDKLGELDGEITCIFAEKKDGTKGLVPALLDKLLLARRKTRASIKYKIVTTKDGTELWGVLKIKNGKHIITKYKEDSIIIDSDQVVDVKDKNTPFQKAVLDGLQQGYKLVCNSVYGQVGAMTGQFTLVQLAAATTATGREMLEVARDKTLEKYMGSKLVYGDTDSVFINFKDYLIKKHGELTNKDLLQKTIEVGQEAGKYVNTFLKNPQDLEYEKTFYPFVIFSKKRYFGNKYEYNTDKFKQTSMGIVLKRRDNAPIVKRIYKGVIDILLNKRNLSAAITYYKAAIRNLLQGNVDIDELVITKSLKSSDSYSNPTRIAHRVLADRMGERDPGNKPQANDRVPYCFIDSRSIRCLICNRKVNEQKCKCLKCMKSFCVEHLKNHRTQCTIICRFYKETIEEDPSIKQCMTCNGWYSRKAMERHHIRKDKYGKIHHDKCKKPLTSKLLQGDIIENPEYIVKKKIKLDYRYYLEHQIQNPVMQIFNLNMKNPTKITEELLREDTNKKTGQQSITKWFNI